MGWVSSSKKKPEIHRILRFEGSGVIKCVFLQGKRVFWSGFSPMPIPPVRVCPSLVSVGALESL